jgi:haloalkane dehalogenase
MNYYAAPYQTIKSRKPLLAWPRAVAFDGGNPKDVAEAVSSWNKWLMASEIPKLCFYVSPGVAVKEKDVKIIREGMKNLKMIDLGEGLHFIQEDYPHEIGEEIVKWLKDFR